MVITCVHTCHLWDSHVFTLFACGMQKIHKQKKVGCALTENLLRTLRVLPQALAVLRALLHALGCCCLWPRVCAQRCATLWWSWSTGDAVSSQQYTNGCR